MKKATLLAIAALAFGVSTQAQNYYLKRVVGGSGHSYLPPSGTSALADAPASGNIDNFLSAPQTIPFSFNFNGAAYTSFKVSENGYITFDVSQTTSNGSNVVLPDAANAPTNAIFAYWSDLRLVRLTANNTSYYSRIYTWTTGTAPNRTQVIQWWIPSEASSATYGAYFAIRLKEGANGDFDIVHSSALGTPNYTATMGWQNVDGTVGYSIPGSPNFNPASTDADVVYSFSQTAPPTVDLALVAHNLQNNASSTSRNVGIKVTNYGGTDVTGFDLNYMLDGGSTVTSPISSVNVMNSGLNILDITHQGSISVSPGMHTLKFWVNNANAGADNNADNDSITIRFAVTNGTPAATLKVVMEEATGAWCQWCPEGHLQLDEITKNNANIIGAVHHSGDGMVNGESTNFLNTYVNSYPSMLIDRAPIYIGTQYIGMTMGNYIGQTYWQQAAETRLNGKVSPFEITILERTWNSTTRQASFKVRVTATDYAYTDGEFRIGAMITEDRVRGIGSQFDQKNVYSNNSNYPSHHYYSYPYTIVGYYHDHVVRSIPSTAFGSIGSIPNFVTPGQTFEKTYTYTLPARTNVTIPDNASFGPKGQVNGMNKEEDMQVVAFVANYNANVNIPRDILNADNTDNLYPASVAPQAENTISFEVYPNPVNGNANIVLNNVKAQDLNIEITNLMGQTVRNVFSGNMAAGTQEVSFNTSGLAAGVYLVKINSAEGSSVVKINVIAE